MLIKSFCKVSAYTKLFLFLFHWLICILIHVKQHGCLNNTCSLFFKGWVRKVINDRVEASTRKSQARFQIIRVSSSSEPRMRLE